MAFINNFLEFTYLSAPYLLLGFFIGGLIHQFLPKSKIEKWLGGNKLSHVIKAAIIGIPLPLCSCSVIPTAISLRKSGASKASTSSFLIATPETGVDSISMTYALMDLPMTIIRPIAAFASAFTAGVLQIFFNSEEVKVEKVEEPVKSCCSTNKKETVKENTFVKGLKYGFGDLSNDIAFWLLVGLTVGSMINFFVPDEFFATLSPTTSRMAIFLIGVPLYICASATTPIAVSLILKGMSPGVALILLLVGPATNVSNIAVLKQYLGSKGVLLNIIAIIIVALGFSYLVDYLYLHYFRADFSIANTSHEHMTWWHKTSGFILLLLIAKGVYLEEIKPRIKKEHHH